MAMNSPVSAVMKGNVDIYATAMKNLINNSEFSDVKFIVGATKEEFFAHRSILAAHCTVFKAMFLDTEDEGGEMIFQLDEMTATTFSAMLEYMYTNSITLNSTIAIDVLATALEYGLDDLRDMSVDFLIKNMTTSNACDVMQASVTFNQNDLKEMAMRFIETNTKDVLCSESFQDLSENALVSILSSSKLAIDEMDLIQAVKNYASKNAEADGKQICTVAREAIKELRLTLLSPEELGNLEKECKTDSFIPPNLFADAKDFLKHGKKESISCNKRLGTCEREHYKHVDDPTAQ